MALPPVVAPLPNGRYTLTVTSVEDTCKPKADKSNLRDLVPSEFKLSCDLVTLTIVDVPPWSSRVKRNDHGVLEIPVTALEGLMAMELSYDANARFVGTWFMESASGDCRTTWHLQGHRVPTDRISLPGAGASGYSLPAI